MPAIEGIGTRDLDGRHGCHSHGDEGGCLPGGTGWGWGKSGWDEGVVVPVAPHLVAAIHRVVGAPQYMLTTPLQELAAPCWIVAAPLQIEAAPRWMVITCLQVGVWMGPQI